MYKFNTESDLINEDDFFSAFEEPREEFVNEVFDESPEEISETEMFESEPPKLLSYAEKLDIAGTIVQFFTNTLDGIIQSATGIKEIGRYRPDTGSEKELAKLVSHYIPDSFNMPVWMQIVIILTASYTPIVMQAKADIKEKKTQAENFTSNENEAENFTTNENEAENEA